VTAPPPATPASPPVFESTLPVTTVAPSTEQSST
jgi:hypothetical protein